MDVSPPTTAPPTRGHTWALTVLTLCAFLLGTGEIMIAGLLPEIAEDAGVSLSTAGLLVSISAITIVVGGPVLAMTTARVRRRRLIAVLLMTFALGNALSALTSSFAVIAFGRVLSALPHAALLPLFLGLVADIVPPARRGTAVGMVSLGLSLSMIIGLPLGAALGQWLSWRATFAAVGLLALVAAGPMLALVRGPHDTPAADGGSGRLAELRVLGQRRVQTVVAVTILSAAATFTAYTYVTPLLRDAVGFDPSTVTLLLLLFGIGGTVGNVVGGRLADRSVTRAVCLGVLALTVTLPLLGAAVPVPPVAVGFLFLFGAAYYAVIPAVNTRMLDVASARARTLALTMQSSAFNLGVAVGGWLGGQVLAGGLPLRWLPVVGGLVAAVALVIAVAEHRGERRRRTDPAGSDQESTAPEGRTVSEVAA
ncbi:MFS transporter, DHA1 family, arabinose polymer transporter [Streptoalloteichus tenebrarius]|uniref:MFS transporter, DHA1 family, arabinose polymer transporter n=1 Tax=Streptoalloteichus tenebrarius (strain ATCC 17920 / DSM 40477 / JCM 4838 / CBS 697.72 / NBRC 16177 / NCIMB 11028 / NRRL B-12390 / A12253. 1 / ISP 5477) TaxID=1933 RepID=A0ABT1HTP0_STRSD|nr:MFS transporter [Streptoalloteichus tenebrarius]MCP2258862.1 MFS transporter, DHA1 family, arabinose polymer transporter [Streptoalloteichus tenebrarius]BFE99454.1 MFS transporter [Streptoalloteichus tenebrarius]